MGKLKIGILGYGNLGRAIEKIASENEKFELVGIFSRRNLPEVKSVDDLLDYVGKIDVLFLCGGSATDLEKQAEKFGKYFCCVDCYDNHSHLKNFIKKMEKMAKENKKVYITAFGWDPGLFSLARGLFATLGENPKTFWGPGLSQGHTNAIKMVKGVKDGLQFTIPDLKILKQIRKGKDFEQSSDFHLRKCFVVAEKKDRARIEKDIKGMPDYFLGYKTKVEFVSNQKLEKLKLFAHGGCVLTTGEKFFFGLKTESNPKLTAKIALMYAFAVRNLFEMKKYGCYTIFDIPLSMVVKDKLRWL